MIRSLACILTVVLVAACGSSTEGPVPVRDAGADGGTVSPDAGYDGGAPDAGSDAGPVDAGYDAGALDAGPMLAANGASCSAGPECVSGRCIDSVCCVTDCDGTCERCDISEDGTCAPVADGEDPDDECGSVSCEDYYVTTDAMCSHRADVADAACGGGGSCQEADGLCPSQEAGDTHLECEACGGLSTGSCMGTTPGTCSLTTTLLDDFAGDTLDDAWAETHLGSGTEPTYVIEDSWLRITDSPPAVTPSAGCSWIYDISTDKGNQVARPVSVGTGDFILEFDFAAASTGPQLTLGGVALTDSMDRLQVRAGYQDGGGATLGTVLGGVGTSTWAGIYEGTATGTIRIERVGTTVTTYRDGVEVHSSTDGGVDIANLVIFHTKHVCGGRTYEYGTFEVGRISLCY